MISPIVEVLGMLGVAFARLDIRWYLFGAQAAIVHGATRMTADVDVTVRCAHVPIDTLIGTLRELGFDPRVADIDGFVQRTRVLPLVHRDSRVPIDAVIAGPGLEDRFLDRAETRELGGVTVPVACAEDVIAMKILAGRDKDMDDVSSIARARMPGLDVRLMEETLRVLEAALDQSDLLPRLRDILKGAGDNPLF